MITTKVQDWRRLHHDAVVIDMHSDIPADVVRRRTLGAPPGAFSRQHAQGWREGGMDAAVVTVGGDQLREPTPHQYAIDTIALLREEETAGDVIIVEEARQLLADAPSNGIRMILNSEGGSAIEGSLDNLHRLHQLGLRFMTLTWSYKNELGTGTGVGSGGLNTFGKSVVREMADLGMVSDVSHTSVDGFWDALRLETGNIIATHSNVAALAPNPRNLTDDQIKAIADQGGVIGVMAVPDFLHGEEPGLNEVVDHIAYIGEKFGMSHVGLGFDLSDFFPEEDYRARLKLNVTNSVNPARFPNYINGFEGVRMTPELTRTMAERGFSEADIRGVLGENLVRAWQRVEARSGGNGSAA
jgi:membrane dipeptidase